MRVFHRTLRVNGSLRVQMFSSHPFPWYQAHRSIDSAKDIPAAVEAFIEGIRKWESENGKADGRT